MDLEHLLSLVPPSTSSKFLSYCRIQCRPIYKYIQGLFRHPEALYSSCHIICTSFKREMRKCNWLCNNQRFMFVLLFTSELVSESLPPLDPLHKEIAIPFWRLHFHLYLSQVVWKWQTCCCTNGHLLFVSFDNDWNILKNCYLYFCQHQHGTFCILDNNQAYITLYETVIVSNTLSVSTVSDFSL
jgi:hypothetical protein